MAGLAMIFGGKKGEKPAAESSEKDSSARRAAARALRLALRGEDDGEVEKALLACHGSYKDEDI